MSMRPYRLYGVVVLHLFVSKGVGQGGLLRPFSFNLYADDLFGQSNASNTDWIQASVLTMFFLHKQKQQ